MKQKKISPKRAAELNRLYRNQGPSKNHFRIKALPINAKTGKSLEKTKPFLVKELLFSLLLTFIIITVQLFISQFI